MTHDEGWTTCARCGQAQRHHGLGCDDSCSKFVSYADLIAERDRLRSLVAEAAALFLFYEMNHRAKVPLTADTLEKAERNRAMAEKLQAALPPRAPDGGEG